MSLCLHALAADGFGDAAAEAFALFAIRLQHDQRRGDHGALAVGTDLMREYGVDSQIGRTAAVMLGSTETTFYTISVYFGAAGVKKTRYALPAALIADLTGFCMAALSVRVFFR